MNAREEIDLDYAAGEESWVTSVTDDLEKSNRRAWIVAFIAAVIALLETVALVWLIPLKTVEPYTLLVDRQTGNVEALAPLDTQTISPDAALTRSFLVQYVIARESFDRTNLQNDYRKTALWSEGSARERYVSMMQASNPQSPISQLPNGSGIRTEVKSVSSLEDGSSMVRFSTTRVDRGGNSQTSQDWVAIINYRFSNAEMSEADRMLNPLGFQVTRYRRDAENLSRESSAASAFNPPAAPSPIATVAPLASDSSDEGEDTGDAIEDAIAEAESAADEEDQ